MSIADAPAYVRNFKKPPKSEIKRIGNSYYLYGCTYQYDKERKRSKKIPGKYLGTITPDGLIPPHANGTASIGKLVLKPSDCVEIGAVCYFYPRTETMRLRLQKHFPELWERIYVIALIRSIYDNRFRRLQTNYEYSVLSHLFPGMSFSPYAVTQFLRLLGMQREAIASYMKEDARDSTRFILFDGHRMLTASRNMQNAEQGYDSRHRYKPQLNVLYVFSLGENTGKPAYYKQYSGGTTDVSAFADILSEAGINGSDITALADKGFASDDDFKLLEDNQIRYIIPLKRGNRFVKGRVPSSVSGYEELFSYRGRAIHSLTFRPEGEGFNIHLFLDASLMADEAADIAARTEKKNAAISKKAAVENKRRENGKGRLSDEQLGSLRTLSINDAYSNKEEIGTITLKTTRTDLTACQCYCLYKQRQNIENFFDSYDNTLGQDASYLQNNISEEGWLFLNHLSSMICIDAIEAIASIGESKSISYKDLTQTLIKIQSTKIGGKWEAPVIKKSAKTLFEKLDFDATDYSVLPMSDDDLVLV